MMKALTYIKPGTIAWKTIEKPKIIEPTDVIGKVLATTICGTDLHIVKGDVPETTLIAEKEPSKGIVLGHEAIIEIQSVGKHIKNFSLGDECIVKCITSCNNCYYCRRNLQSHCNGNEGSSGWILGHEIDGTQAEYVRIPFADTSLIKVPKNVPYESLLLLCDAMPTSYEIGVLSGNVKKDDVVAIIGMGPVGLSALLTSKTLEPSQIIAIDIDDSRLQTAKKFGATHVINPTKFSKEKLISEVLKLTTGLVVGREPGVDVAIECVGTPETFEMCEDILTSGGSIANVGVHGKAAELKLQNLWIKNCRITTGLVSTFSAKELLEKVVDSSLDPSLIVSHHFKFDEFEKAYDVFKSAAATKAMKVMLTP